jgi:hypothetical protein
MSSSGKSSVALSLSRPNSRKLIFLSTNPEIDTNDQENRNMIKRGQSLKRLLVGAATLSAPMINRGADIELILGGNFRRVLRQIWSA